MDNLLSFPRSSTPTIMLFQPTDLSEAEEALAALKAGQMLLTNVNSLQTQDVQRMTDYLRGSTNALSGAHREIGNGVYLFAPPTMKVTKTDSPETEAELDMQSA